MKLTIEHLAPYLPYELKFYKKKLHLMQRSKHPHNKDNDETIMYLHDNSRKGKMLGLKPNLNKVITSAGSFNLSRIVFYKYGIDRSFNQWFKFLEWYKPILRPLSDLLIPEYALFTGIYSDLNKVIINNHYKKWGVCEYEELLKNHYDVFELIENNLAVDINSIK